MAEKKSKRMNVLGKIREMEVGVSIPFPIEWLDTVRAQTSKVNAIYGGKRTTRMETKKRKIVVTRMS